MKRMKRDRFMPSTNTDKMEKTIFPLSKLSVALSEPIRCSPPRSHPTRYPSKQFYTGRGPIVRGLRARSRSLRTGLLGCGLKGKIWIRVLGAGPRGSRQSADEVALHLCVILPLGERSLKRVGAIGSNGQSSSGVLSDAGPQHFVGLTDSGRSVPTRRQGCGVAAPT